MHLSKALIALLLLLMANCTLSGQVTNEQPLKLKAEFQIHEGKRTGTLVLSATVPDGHYMYSLTQKKVPPATKLKVEESKSYKIAGKFKPNKKPKVAFDEIFNNNIEKHFDTVKFSAPIELAEGVNPQDVEIVISFTGQVCDDQSCTRIRNKKTSAAFSGYAKAPKD